jgi:hypothetical protein
MSASSYLLYQVSGEDLNFVNSSALYRAAYILLYRIFLPNAVPLRTVAPAGLTAEAVSTCTRMAEQLHLLFMLYSKTFKLKNMTYTLSWSMVSE